MESSYVIKDNKRREDKISQEKPFPVAIMTAHCRNFYYMTVMSD